MALIARESFVLPRAPEEGTEVLAIGDIHGCSELFDALLDAAAREPKRAERRVLVLTGDLVDRGPDNLGTLALAREASARVGADGFAPLMGNHEAMMRFCMDPEVPFSTAVDTIQNWSRNGGAAVMRELWPAGFAGARPEAIVKKMRTEVPPHILSWLRGLRGNFRSGGLLFVHAGVNPKLDLETFLAQPWDLPLRFFDEARHWSWVRGPFLSHKPGPEGFSGHLVVHGHTPLDAGHAPLHADQIARFRLNLDGGSYMTGEAKMALIRGAQAEVFTAKSQGGERTNR